jgi:hypothetical protein
MADDKILSRIRKLLALANNNPSVEEAASAMSMAMKLMRRHNIEEIDVIQQELRSSDNVVRKPTTVRPAYREQMADWFNVLVTGVARTLDCHTSIYRDERGLYIALHGYKADVEVADWLISYLHRQIEALADVAWTAVAIRIREEKARAPWASERTRVKNSYRHGMVNAILDRVYKVYAKAPSDSSGESAAQVAQQNSLVVLKDSLVFKKFPGLNREYDKAQVKHDEHSLRGRLDADKVKVQRVLQESEEEQLAQLSEAKPLALTM